MNYTQNPNSLPMTAPASLPQTAYRPDELRSLIALAQQRIEFHQEQIDVVAEGMQAIIEAHNSITLHYQALVQNDVRLIQQMQAYLAGNRMLPNEAPLPFAPGNSPIAFGALAAPPHPPETNGVNGHTNGHALLPTAEDEAIKAQLLQQFSTPADHKPVFDPNPAYNGKSRHQVVAEAAPLPQAKVSVAHYEEGEELPPEAIPGHMKSEPRTAEELTAERKAKLAKEAATYAANTVAHVAKVEIGEPPPGAVSVQDEEAAPKPATVVQTEEV